MNWIDAKQKEVLYWNYWSGKMKIDIGFSSQMKYTQYKGSHIKLCSCTLNDAKEK